MKSESRIFRASKLLKVALCLLLLFLHTAILNAGAPLIRIDNPDYDFGTIYGGENAEHDLRKIKQWVRVTKSVSAI